MRRGVVGPAPMETEDMETMNSMIAVPFHNDTVWATERDGAVLVAVKPICEALGVDWKGQLERCKRDAVLVEGIRVMRIPSPGGEQETVCLPLNLLPGWLFGIDDRRLKDDATREKVLAYKRECYAVLYEHFFGAAHGADDAPADAPRLLLPGHPDFSEAVRLVREARLSRGKSAALALWRQIGLPWVPELEADAGPAALAADGTDPVALFAREEIERAPGVLLPARALWPAYVAFCNRRDFEPGGQASFQTRFGRMGFAKRKTSGRVIYQGIRPKIEASHDGRA